MGADVDSDEAFVLSVSWELLKRTWPWVKDARGYNKFDAWLVRAVWEKVLQKAESLTEMDIQKLDVAEVRKSLCAALSSENLEWLRRDLLKYEKQIRALGFDYDRLNTIRLSENAVFSNVPLTDVKLATVTITISKQTSVIVKYRVFNKREQKKIIATFAREKGLEAVDSLKLPIHFTEYFAVGSDIQHGQISKLKLVLDADQAIPLLQHLSLGETVNAH